LGLKIAKGENLSPIADKAFASNPLGMSWDKNALLSNEELIALAKKPIVEKTWEDYGLQDIKLTPEEKRNSNPGVLERAPSREEALEILKRELKLDENGLRYVETPIQKVLINSEQLKHMVEKESDAREMYSKFVVPTLENPTEIWLTKFTDGYRPQYVAVFKESNGNGLIVSVRLNKDGSLFWNYMQNREKKLNNKRTGTLLYKKT